MDKIFDKEVEDYICYWGESCNGKNEMKNEDGVVEFSVKD